MSKCQTDGFSEADGILGTGQRGRGGETEVQSMGIQAGAGWGGMGGAQDHYSGLSVCPLCVPPVCTPDPLWQCWAPNVHPLIISPALPLAPLLAASSTGFPCEIRARLCPTDPRGSQSLLVGWEGSSSLSDWGVVVQSPSSLSSWGFQQVSVLREGSLILWVHLRISVGAFRVDPALLLP